jgi:hypothetical protein
MDKAKGTIKENVGDATDNEELEREGKMDRAGVTGHKVPMTPGTPDCRNAAVNPIASSGSWAKSVMAV